jgi:hypothetical protein
MRYIKLLAVCVVIGAYPTALALAHRAPTRSEKAALTHAFDSYVKQPAPARCLQFEVSTRNAAWADVAFAPRSPKSCLKYASNGDVIFHHTSGKWRFVTAGSSFVSGNGTCHVPHVPKPVVADFRLCGGMAS